MSRHTQYNSKYEMAYGRDHIFGLFIQVFERARKNDDDEGIRVDLDEEKDHLTPERMCELAEEYGFQIEPPQGIVEIE